MVSLKDVERMLFQTMEGEVIGKLLSGNDTQCFSTAQYCEARDAWIEGVTGSTRRELGMGVDMQDLLVTARNQLRHCPLVTEVRPDVWARPDFAAELPTIDYPA